MMARQRIYEKWQTAKEVQLSTVLDLGLSDATVYRFGRLVITSIRLHDVGLVGAKEPPPTLSETPSDTEVSSLASELASFGLPTSFGKKGSGQGRRDFRREPALATAGSRLGQRDRQQRPSKVSAGGACDSDSVGVAPQGTAAATDTPWLQGFDERWGCHYYYNSITQESVWEAPAEGFVPWQEAAAALAPTAGAAEPAAGSHQEREDERCSSMRSAPDQQVPAHAEDDRAHGGPVVAIRRGQRTPLTSAHVPTNESSSSDAGPRAPALKQPPRMLTEEDLLRTMGLLPDTTREGKDARAVASGGGRPAAGDGAMPAQRIDSHSPANTFASPTPGVESDGSGLKQTGTGAGAGAGDGASSSRASAISGGGASLKDLLRLPFSQHQPQHHPQTSRAVPPTALSEEQLLARLGAAVPGPMPPPPPAPLPPPASPPPPQVDARRLQVAPGAPSSPQDAPGKPHPPARPTRMLTEEDILRSMGLLPSKPDEFTRPAAADPVTLPGATSQKAVPAAAAAPSSAALPSAAAPAVVASAVPLAPRAPAPPPGFGSTPAAAGPGNQERSFAGTELGGTTAHTHEQRFTPGQGSAGVPQPHHQDSVLPQRPSGPPPGSPPVPQPPLNAALPHFPLDGPPPPPGFHFHGPPHGPMYGPLGQPLGEQVHFQNGPSHLGAAGRPPPGFGPPSPHLGPQPGVWHGPPNGPIPPMAPPYGPYGLPPPFPPGAPMPPMIDGPPGFGPGPMGQMPPPPYPPELHPYHPYGPPVPYGVPLYPPMRPPPPPMPFPMHPHSHPHPYGPPGGPEVAPGPMHAHLPHPHPHGHHDHQQKQQPAKQQRPQEDGSRTGGPAAVQSAEGEHRPPAQLPAAGSAAVGSAAAPEPRAVPAAPGPPDSEDAKRRTVTWTLQELERQFELMAASATGSEAQDGSRPTAAAAGAGGKAAAAAGAEAGEQDAQRRVRPARHGPAARQDQQRAQQHSEGGRTRRVGAGKRGAAEQLGGDASTSGADGGDDEASFYDSFVAANASGAAGPQQAQQRPVPAGKPPVGSDDGTRRVTLDPATAAYVRTLLPRSAAKYWMQRYSLFSRFDSNVQLDTEGWWSVTPEVLAAHQATRCRELCATGLVAMDACCGCGGNVIQMTGSFPVVIGVEISERRVEMARHNAAVYEVSHKCQFLCADFFKVAPDLKVDVLFMSPPWGGPKYQHVNTFDVFYPLVGFNKSLLRLLDVTLDCVRGQDGVVAAFLPRNTDLTQLAAVVPEHAVWEVERAYVNNKLKGITVYCHPGRTSKEPNVRLKAEAEFPTVSAAPEPLAMEA